MKEERAFYTPALLALLTVSTYFLADTVDAMIGRVLDAAPEFASPLERDRSAQPRRELADYASILERGLFGEGKGPSGGSASVGSTTYKLIGTVEGEAFAGAVLDDGTGQTFHRVDQKLPDGSVIIKVMRDKVALRRPDGAIVNVEIVDDTKIVAARKNGNAGVKRLSDGKFVVDQREVVASTENLSQILTQARALPYMEQGKIAGFRINQIVPGSMYAKIGLQNGDVIRQVNGQALDDPGKFFQLYQGLRDERSITIDLMRSGRRQTLNYEIR
jgi:general secretion pathway protein C